jgi:hypothetical protein
MSRFNQLLILIVLLILTLFAKLALAEDCYYGTETQKNLKDLQDLSGFQKKHIENPYVEFQFNGRSVSADEYERLTLRARSLPKTIDPNMVMP